MNTWLIFDVLSLKKAEIPLALLLLPFITGVAFAIAVPCINCLLSVQLLFYGLLLLFVGLNVFYTRINLYKLKWVGGLLVNLLILLGGVIAIETHREINNADHFSKIESKYLIAHVSSEPKFNSNMLRFTAVVQQAEKYDALTTVTGNLMVSVKTDTIKKNKLAYGDELLFKTNFTVVNGPANPGEFNYKTYLAHQNIYHQCFLTQQQIVVLKKDQGNWVIAGALSLRRHLVEKLRANIPDSNALAVASTMILGYRADLSKQTQEAFAKTGTMHLLAVSGMHVGYIYLFISFLLAFLPPNYYGKTLKVVVSVLVIWCYALITGFSPAVCRAALMLSFVLLGSAFGRHVSRLNLLALSAFILLLFNPFVFADAGFQLSYVAVFGIILLQPIVYKWINVKNKPAQKIWMVCSVSIVAQIILFPVSAFYFHDFPVYFLISNLFVVVPSIIIMSAGIIYLLLPQIPFVSPALGWLLQKTILMMTKILFAIEHAPLGSISKIWLYPSESVLIYGVIICFFYCVTEKNKAALKLSIAFLLLIAISVSIKRYRSMNTNSITFFSLRKNSGILLRQGDNAVLMSDLNITDKTYQYSVQPYLDSCKITRFQNIGLNENIQVHFASAYGGLIQYRDKKLLIINKLKKKEHLAIQLKLDYIYITGSPMIDIHYLIRNYNFKSLIIDAHNSNRVIDQLEQQATQAGINFRNLKSNNSLTIVSKQ